MSLIYSYSEKFKDTHLARLRIWFLAVWSALTVVQLVLSFNVDSTIVGILTIIGGGVGVCTYFRRSMLLAYPISTLMLLGFTSYYFLLPPVATIIEFKPLTNNLIHPVLVCLHSFISLLSLSCAHAVYRTSKTMQTLRWLISEKLYRRMSFFNSPTNWHLLAMGVIGLVATSFQIFVVGSAQNEALGASNKFMQALFPLAYLPFCLVVRPVMGEDSRITRKWSIVLIVYTTLIVLLSMGRNSRSAFLLGIMSIVLTYVYGRVVGIFPKLRIKFTHVIIAALAIWLLMGPITDFAITMVLMRGQRLNLSAMQLVSETLSTFNDKESIEKFKTLTKIKEKNDEWDEHYVDNLFLSRLCNLKFTDQSIHLANLLDEEDTNVMRQEESQRVLSVLPRPILELLPFNVDKDAATSSSGGDLLFFVATKSPLALGGARTGSILGSGFALFGWFYVIILGILSLIIFSFADAQTSRASIVTNSQIITIPVFSPMTIAALFTWFFYLTSAATGVESMSGLTVFIIRGWLQTLLIYSFAYYLSLFIIRPFQR